MPIQKQYSEKPWNSSFRRTQTRTFADEQTRRTAVNTRLMQQWRICCRVPFGWQFSDEAVRWIWSWLSRGTCTNHLSRAQTIPCLCLVNLDRNIAEKLCYDRLFTLKSRPSFCLKKSKWLDRKVWFESGSNVFVKYNLSDLNCWLCAWFSYCNGHKYHMQYTNELIMY